MLTPDQITKLGAALAAASAEARKMAEVELFRANVDHVTALNEAFIMVDGFLSGDIETTDPEWGQSKEDFEGNLLALAALSLVLLAESKEGISAE